MAAISSDMRPPYTTREKMSRPMLSVPNQYSVDGAALKASLILLGSLMKGRKAANTARNVTSTTQPTERKNPISSGLRTFWPTTSPSVRAMESAAST